MFRTPLFYIQSARESWHSFLLFCLTKIRWTMGSCQFGGCTFICLIETLQFWLVEARVWFSVKTGSPCFERWSWARGSLEIPSNLSCSALKLICCVESVQRYGIVLLWIWLFSWKIGVFKHRHVFKGNSGVTDRLLVCDIPVQLFYFPFFLKEVRLAVEIHKGRKATVMLVMHEKHL